MPVSDVSRSQITRIISSYDLTPRVFDLMPHRRLDGRTDLDRLYDFGRVQRHVRAAARLLPTAAVQVELSEAAVGVAGQRLDLEPGPGRALLLVTPRGDPLLLLELELPGTVSASQVARLLAATCFFREQLTIDGEPILGRLTRQLGQPDGSPPTLAFGGNVHQCVFAGGALGDELLTTLDEPPAPGATTIINRGTRTGQFGIRTPRALNNTGETLVAHSRGVSVVVGWSRPLQNVLALVATTTVSALGVLHSAREQAFDALELSQTTGLVSTADARRLVSQLSARLSEVQLDLSFGVEAYVDSVLIPELLVDSFQSSMRAAADLEAGLANTSRMVDRLATVTRARAAVLAAATQDEQDQRNRVLNVMLAVGSMIALPPSLLLAFFSVTSPEVDPARSILDLGRYWLAYGLAWLPFTALVLTGFLLRRRIRARSRLVEVDDPPAGPADRLVPAPRAGAEPSPAPSATRA